MLIWMALIGAILIMSATAVWYRTRNIEYQLNFVAAKLDKCINSRKTNHREVGQLLKRIHSLIYNSLNDINTVNAYKAIDLLKLAYGCGMQRDNEYQRLGSIAIAAMRNHQPDIAGIALGAFRPLIRTIPMSDLSLAIDQLTLIAVLAARLKYNFLLAKVLENLFDATVRSDCMGDKQVVNAVLRSVRMIGLTALRRHDYDLFRELTARFKIWTRDIPAELLVDGDGLFIVWLHQLAKSGDAVALETVTQLGLDLYANKAITADRVSLIISEASKAAGTACLSQLNTVPPLILQFILEIAEKGDDLTLWRKAVNSVAQVVSLSSSRRGVIESFLVLLPILDTGRRLLADELKFGEFSDGFRRQRLFVIIKESVLVAELHARQQMTSNPGEVITEIYEHWASLPQTIGIQKSIKRYCQLLLLYWQNTRKRQARRGMSIDKRLTEPMLVSDKDRKRLGI